MSEGSSVAVCHGPLSIWTSTDFKGVPAFQHESENLMRASALPHAGDHGVQLHVGNLGFHPLRLRIPARWYRTLRGVGGTGEDSDPRTSIGVRVTSSAP